MFVTFLKRGSTFSPVFLIEEGIVIPHASLEFPLIFLYFSSKMGNRYSNSLKLMEIYMEIQYIRENQSLYHSNEAESQHWVYKATSVLQRSLNSPRQIFK